jgi:hypothetical protein
MRGFKHAASADILARGHGCIQNLRNDFSTLTCAGYLSHPASFLAWIMHVASTEDMKSLKLLKK